MSFLIFETALSQFFVFIFGIIIGYVLKNNNKQDAYFDNFQSELVKTADKKVDTAKEKTSSDSPFASFGKAVPEAIIENKIVEEKEAPLLNIMSSPAKLEEKKSEVIDFFEEDKTSKHTGKIVTNDDITIESIEGIGKSYARKLQMISISTTKDFLEKCNTPEDFDRIAKHLNVDPIVIKQWWSMADLLRIPTMTGQFAELLTASGVQSVPELLDKNSSKLLRKLERVNEVERRAPTTPSEKLLREWINSAKELSRKSA
jgi:predicted flap endonuclease-1-like 5' DNA nuclease